MKTKYYLLYAFIGFLNFSCNKSLERNVEFDINIKSNEQVQYDGNIVTVKKGTPIEFLITGNPNFMTFFSGEEGHQYKYKDRMFVGEEDLEECKLSFSLYNGKFNSHMTPNILRIYISDNFPGLAKNNFENDSILVESHPWNDLVSPEELPQSPILSADEAIKYNIDLKSQLGKKFTIAIRYLVKETTEELRQPGIFFENAQIVTTFKNGTSTTLYPAAWGLTPLNMRHKEFPPTDASLKENPAYGTTKNNVGGYWNLYYAAQGDFKLWGEFSGLDKPKHYSWLVTNPIITNSCLPDAGVAIKNIATPLYSYTYKYDKPGAYKATFLGKKVNYEHSSSEVIEFEIHVIE